MIPEEPPGKDGIIMLEKLIEAGLEETMAKGLVAGLEERGLRAMTAYELGQADDGLVAGMVAYQGEASVGIAFQNDGSVVAWMGDGYHEEQVYVGEPMKAVRWLMGLLG